MGMNGTARTRPKRQRTRYALSAGRAGLVHGEVVRPLEAHPAGVDREVLPRVSCLVSCLAV